MTKDDRFRGLEEGDWDRQPTFGSVVEVHQESQRVSQEYVAGECGRGDAQEVGDRAGRVRCQISLAVTTSP